MTVILSPKWWQGYARRMMLAFGGIYLLATAAREVRSDD